MDFDFDNRIYCTFLIILFFFYSPGVMNFSFINKEVDFNNNIIANKLIPMCGINLFSNHKDFNKRPPYWGGYSFTPYYFEFWEGNINRLNKRIMFEKKNGNWDKYFLEP